jgi:hypothetical protein
MFGGLVAVKQRGEGLGDLRSFIGGFSNGFLSSGAGPGLTQDQIDSGVYDPVFNPSGDVNLYPSSSLPSVVASTPTITTTQAPNNNATPGWIALLAGAEKVISNIFAPAQATVAQAEASRPVYVQSTVAAPGVRYNPDGTPIQNIANTGASITNQLLGFVQQNPLTVGAIVVGIVLWKSGRK